MPSGVYIRKYNPVINLKGGWLGKKRPPFSEEWRSNLSKSLKGRESPNKGKKFSNEWRKKLSLGKIGNLNAHGRYGKTYGRKKYPRSYHFRDSTYMTWRSAVFQRDNWTCQTCQIRGVYLEAHHIKSWAKYPELRYVLENGQTLCKECHKLTANYKNKKND